MDKERTCFSLFVLSLSLTRSAFFSSMCMYENNVVGLLLLNSLNLCIVEVMLTDHGCVCRKYADILRTQSRSKWFVPEYANTSDKR